MKDGLAEVADLDARDPLAPFRDEFRLRDGLIYVDGNSLGALPKATAARLAATVTEEGDTPPPPPVNRPPASSPRPDRSGSWPPPPAPCWGQGRGPTPPRHG